MKNDGSGFTLVEVLVAVMVLSVGIVAMASSSGTTTRMIGWGKIDTRAAQAAARTLDTLRLRAYSTTPPCTALASGGPVTAANITTSWTVTTTAANERTVAVTVTYQKPKGTKTRVLTTFIKC